MVSDPVCGMEIEPQAAATTRDHMGQTFYFCSTPCAAAFDANPHQYMRQETVGSGAGSLVFVIETFWSGHDGLLKYCRIR